MREIIIYDHFAVTVSDPKHEFGVRRNHGLWDNTTLTVYPGEMQGMGIVKNKIQVALHFSSFRL